MNPYFEQMVLSASPVELVRLLYQRAISAVREAREHLKSRRIEARCDSINLAYSVLMELTSSLRMEDAPELTANLNALYAYMQARLIDANVRQDDEPLAEVVGLLMTLAEAWNSIPDPWVLETVARNPWSVGTESSGDPVYRAAVSA